MILSLLVLQVSQNDKIDPLKKYLKESQVQALHNSESDNKSPWITIFGINSFSPQRFNSYMNGPYSLYITKSENTSPQGLVQI